MYTSTALASEILKKSNEIWSSYNELWTVLHGTVGYLRSGGDSSSGNVASYYGEKERREHLIRCLNSIEEDVKALHHLYPKKTLQGIFQGVLELALGIHRLLSEHELSEVVVIPGLNYCDALQAAVAELSGSIYSLLSGIADRIYSETPLSGLPADSITIELVELNYQAAIEHAFTLFEDHLRQRIGVGPDVYGESLINLAFGKNGRLTYGATRAEDVGVRNLMSGAYATFRNPRKHRIVKDSEQAVSAIITLVDLLTQIVDEAQEVK